MKPKMQEKIPVVKQVPTGTADDDRGQMNEPEEEPEMGGRPLTDEERSFFETHPELTKKLRNFIWWIAIKMTNDLELQMDLTQRGWLAVVKAMPYYTASKTQEADPLPFFRVSAGRAMRDFFEMEILKNKKHSNNTFKILLRSNPELRSWDKITLPAHEVIATMAARAGISESVARNALETRMFKTERYNWKHPDAQLHRALEGTQNQPQESADELLIKREEQEIIRTALRILDERPRQVITLYYWGDENTGELLTDQEIADRLGSITRQRVQQIRQKAIKDLGDYLKTTNQPVNELDSDLGQQQS